MRRFETPEMKLEKELRMFLPEAKNLFGNLPEDAKLVKTGTTIVAIRYKDGALIGADKQTTDGHLIFQHDTQKLHILSDCSVIGAAGTVAFIQWAIQLLKNHIRYYEVENDSSMPLKKQAETLRIILRFMFLNLGYIASEFIIAGYDVFDEAPRIYQLDCIGGKYPDHRYISTGSGYVLALSTMDQNLSNTKEDPPVEMAVDIAIKALVGSGYRDIYTGKGLPDIFKIEKVGISQVILGMVDDENKSLPAIDPPPTGLAISEEV